MIQLLDPLAMLSVWSRVWAICATLDKQQLPFIFILGCCRGRLSRPTLLNAASIQYEVGPGKEEDRKIYSSLAAN